MSRTVKNKKGPGYEYWSRRPHNKSGGLPGKVTKKKTKRTERQTGKKMEREED
jgi:hypothetical protein